MEYTDALSLFPQTTSKARARHEKWRCKVLVVSKHKRREGPHACDANRFGNSSGNATPGRGSFMNSTLSITIAQWSALYPFTPRTAQTTRGVSQIPTMWKPTVLLAAALAIPAHALHFFMDGAVQKCFYEELPKDTLVVGALNLYLCNLWIYKPCSNHENLKLT